LGALNANAQGQFALQTLIPESLPHGRQVIQAQDLDSHMATAALSVLLGGWPPIGVQVTAERAEPSGSGPSRSQQLHVEIALVNRSGWHLRAVNVTAAIPAGTRLLFEGLEGPEDIKWTFENGLLRWNGARLDAHTYGDPYAFDLEISGLPPGTPLPTPEVTVTFQHTTPPLFRGAASAQ
jgi:hypothetical protein